MYAFGRNHHRTRIPPGSVHGRQQMRLILAASSRSMAVMRDIYLEFMPQLSGLYDLSMGRKRLFGDTPKFVIAITPFSREYDYTRLNFVCTFEENKRCLQKEVSKTYITEKFNRDRSYLLNTKKANPSKEGDAKLLA